MTDAADRISRAQLATLVGGQGAGHYTLPSEIDQALRAEAYLNEQLHAARHEVNQLHSTGEVIGRLADDVLDAAAAGTSLPDLTQRVNEAEQADAPPS